MTLIGFGNWGTALASALHDAGFSVSEIIVRRGSRINSAASRKLVRTLGAEVTTLERAALDAQILWICTPDANIGSAAKALAERIQLTGKRSARIVFHSSGALTSGELSPLQKVGASLASVHPLMTFPRRRNGTNRRRESQDTHQTFPLAGVPFAIEGDADACRAARRLASAMGGVPFTLRERDKPLYHAFGALLSPLLIALLSASTEAGAKSGPKAKNVRRLMRPIVERTIANFFNEGPENSFSGPFARGDVDTVRRHMLALRSQPGVREVYRALAMYAVTGLPGARKAEIRKVLARRT